MYVAGRNTKIKSLTLLLQCCIACNTIYLYKDMGMKLKGVAAVTIAANESLIREDVIQNVIASKTLSSPFCERS